MSKSSLMYGVGAHFNNKYKTTHPTKLVAVPVYLIWLEKHVQKWTLTIFFNSHTLLAYHFSYQNSYRIAKLLVLF